MANTHGGLSDSSHAGDLGNIQSDKNGVSIVEKRSFVLKLQSNSQFNIKGRAVAIHQNQDDLGK